MLSFNNSCRSGMWVKSAEVLFSLCILLVLLNIAPINCHLPSYMSTPSNKIEQFCLLSDTCVHDTIPICGKMGDETRTFLDLCDLLEFACDTNQIFSHVEDMAGCPVTRDQN